jgi:hypothetical protein
MYELLVRFSVEFPKTRRLEHLEDDKKKTLYDLIDTYIRDAKGRKTYAA